LPAHPLLVGLDLGKRRARRHNERYIALRQVDVGAVEMIGEIGAARAALHPARSEHEVINQKLALAAEQAGERLASARAVEAVDFFNLDPGQLAALRAESVALPGEFLFLGEQRLARREPFVLGNDFVLHAGAPYILAGVI